MKSWNMLKFFTKHYDVSLVSPIKYGISELENFDNNIDLNAFYTDAVEVPRTGLNLAKSYLKCIPLNVYRSYSKELKRRVEEIIDEFDVIVLDHYESFQYLPNNFKGKVVLHTHNATYLMWQRYAQSGENFAFRTACAMEASRVKKYEAKAVARADQVFASPNDIDNLVAIGGLRAKFRETFHLGDDSQLALPELEFAQTGETLLYVGTLSWEANVDGLLWFMDKVWPAVKGRFPNIRFKIAGGNPDPRIVEMARGLDGVELLGFVDDLEPLFQEARLFMSPLLFGSGIKVKVLNAMCRGIPTITTPVGAEGLDVVDGEHLSISETPEQMIEAICNLMVDQAKWEKLRDQSRALVEARYTWSRVLGYMMDEMDSLIAEELAPVEAV
jgi:glycosyltransferase involved in cell wall biosynthesis